MLYKNYISEKLENNFKMKAEIFFSQHTYYTVKKQLKNLRNRAKECKPCF